MADKFNNFSYSGTESYKYVEAMFRSSKRILIVSPYIDDYYARFISSQSYGKEVYVITSNPQESAVGILKGMRHSAFQVVLSGSAMIAGFAFFVLGYRAIGTLLIGLSVLAFYFLLWSKRGNGKIDVKVPKKFVHAKMYIGDGSAIYGSANMTYNGMHKNVEHIERVEDPIQLKELEYQFWRMWDGL